LLGIHRETVRSYVNEAMALGFTFSAMAEAGEKELYGWFGKAEMTRGANKGKSGALYALFPYIQKELGRTGVDRQVLYDEYKKTDPHGYSYNHFCRQYRLWCAAREVAGVLEHKAGDKVFIDFAGKRLAVTDRDTGEMKAVEVFVAILGFSQFTYVEATPSQKRDAFINAVENMLHYIGGVPAAIVPDNLKSAVYKANKYEPELNEAFERFALHYGTTIMPARPRKPRDKAKVEAAVLIVQRWILARLRNRRFFSLAELNVAIRILVDELNARLMRKLGASRREFFDTIDRPALMPLPAEPYQYAEWRRARVAPDYHVEVQGHFYSVPSRMIRQVVEVRATEATIEVFHRGTRIASHARSGVKRRHTTIPEHMPSAHRRYASWTPARLLAAAEKVGPSTIALCEAIMRTKPHPEQGFRSCLGILRLEKTYGTQRLEAACRRGISIGSASYRSIASILKTGLDKAFLPDTTPDADPIQHGNIRGRGYYH